MKHLPKMWPVTPSAGNWGGTAWLDTHAAGRFRLVACDQQHGHRHAHVPQPPGRLQPVHPGQPDVEHHDVVRLLPEPIEARLARIHGVHRIAFVAQHAAEAASQHARDDDDGERLACRARRAGGGTASAEFPVHSGRRSVSVRPASLRSAFGAANSRARSARPPADPACRGSCRSGRLRTAAPPRPRPTGRTASRPGRPGVRSGRAAGCRCAATRGARCRARRARQARRRPRRA